jgi:hypothetical protein
MLTLRLMEDSMKPIIVEVEGIAMNSGELLKRGTVKYSRLRPPLDAKLLPNDEEGEAILPVCLSELGVVGIDDMPERAPMRALVIAADRERMREIERAKRD